jgi:hypothetical protein
MIAEQVLEGGHRRAAMERIEQWLDPDPTKALEEVEAMEKVWKAQARSSPAIEVYEKRLARIWRETGCASEGAPYVLRGLLDHLETRIAPIYGGHIYGAQNPFGPQSPQLPALANAFLDEKHCPGAHGLTEYEKARLKAIRDNFSPLAPKQ